MLLLLYMYYICWLILKLIGLVSTVCASYNNFMVIKIYRGSFCPTVILYDQWVL